MFFMKRELMNNFKSFLKKHPRLSLYLSFALGFPAVFLSPAMVEVTGNGMWFLPVILIGLPSLYVQYQIFPEDISELR
tara:strand:+ start:2083 stop:2316 length:234 start_codon:yes stop_codon:yes gene_type:complete